LEGYCPVSLAEQQRLHPNQRRWVVGDRRWGATHQGRTYLFAGPEEQREFLDRPWLYAPAFAGDDPVLLIDQNRTVPGKREHGLYFNKQIYLFSEEGTLEHFRRDPRPYIEPPQQTGRRAPQGGQFR
jgi:YHS domain-containing protein